MMDEAPFVEPPVESLNATEGSPGHARLVLVFVLDGLRPDAINPVDTPTLFRLRQEGVHYLNSHAVFPTVTRVNAAAIGTGAYPGTNGIVSNVMYVPEVNQGRPFSLGDFQHLVSLDMVSGGRLVLVKSLGERLQEHALRLAVVSSGTTGTSLLLNPHAIRGVGTLVNGYFDPGRLVAFPPEVNKTILERFGPAPAKGGTSEPHRAAVDWTEDVLREFVLPELRPDVVFNWVTEPDHMQHAFGAGAPESRQMLHNDDRHIERILDRLQAQGLAEQTDIFVVSDHGFSRVTFAVNVAQAFMEAGLKAALDSDDVVLASSDQAVLLHVRNHDPARIRQLVEWLQTQEWAGVIFTRGNSAPDVQGPADSPEPQGWVEGTFSLELIHLANDERGPDILFTFPWTSAKNSFGLAGTDVMDTMRATGARSGQASNHGSMSPWTIRNTCFAWGVDFKRGVEVRVPASNVDLVPTILALKGIPASTSHDGRVLREALMGGPDEEQIWVETRVLKTQARRSHYQAAIQVSTVEHQRYIDKSWRMR
jgi:predicted AlkP superfamily pyrophosphatase or phosphodiesterase